MPVFYLCFCEAYLATAWKFNWELLTQAGNMASIVEFPCGSCKEEISDSHAAVQCDSCMQWYHVHCQKSFHPSVPCICQSWEFLLIVSELWFSHSSGRVESLPVSNHYSVLEPAIWLKSDLHTLTDYTTLSAYISVILLSDFTKTADTMDDLANLITTLEDASIPLSPQSNGKWQSHTCTSTPLKPVQQTKTPNVHQFSKLKVMCINCQSIQKGTEKHSK